MKLKILFPLVFGFCYLSICSQDLFPSDGVIFDDTAVPKISIIINADSLEQMLLEENLNSDHEYPADFIWYDGKNLDTLKNIGFRLRGNTSRVAAKKSFKIKFEYFGGKKFHGTSDLNLNGEHNDPTIARSKICFDLFKKAGVPSSRVNHVRLYINDEYRGIYMNIEHIDKEYLQERYEDISGNLYKCFYGCDFKYLGENKNNYKFDGNGNPVYELKTNNKEDDYSDLIAFTKILRNPASNTYQCDIERIFNVDSYIKAAAMEVLLGHWDGPIFNKNNAYLYSNPATGKFDYIPYDLDNTLGIDWFNINWANRNIYNWSVGNSQRPIYDNLMFIPEYRNRFGYYIDKYLQEFFNPSSLFQSLDEIKNRISPYREEDSFAEQDYGYDYENFLTAYDSGLWAHASKGIKEYLSERYNSVPGQIQTTEIKPILRNNEITWDESNIFSTIELEAKSAANLVFNYSFDNQNWLQIDMLDNGVYPDLKAGDDIYSTIIEKSGLNDLLYYFEATDIQNKFTRLPRCGSNMITTGYDAVPALFINEFMASNSTIADDAGEYDDWIEIYNQSNQDVYLGDKYLTDDFSNIVKWQMPDISIQPNGFLLFWADEDQDQGENHTNFKISKNGEFLGIFDNKENNFAPIDTFTFGMQEENITYGRLPDGLGPIIRLQNVTPGTSNGVTSVNFEEIYNVKVFPNPLRNWFRLSADKEIITVVIYNLHGKKVYAETVNSKHPKIYFPPIPDGLYILNIGFEDYNILRKVILE